MPLSALQPVITARFHEVDIFLTRIAAGETANPTIPDSLETRIMRGLFFVHLYAAFEYSIDQMFIRLAQFINSRNIYHRHLHRPVFSVAMDDEFTALQDLRDWHKKYKKRLDTLEALANVSSAQIRDTVLSVGMQSADIYTIATAFAAYGIADEPFIDLPTRTYISEVVQKRHAIAHGRESPVAYGNQRVADLRTRYVALYNQATYVLDVLNNFANDKRFVLSRHRAKY